MAARLRSLHTLASRLLSAHASPRPLLRTLNALTRIAEGEVVSDEIADRLPAPLVVALLIWRDALHST